MGVGVVRVLARITKRVSCRPQYCLALSQAGDKVRGPYEHVDDDDDGALLHNTQRPGRFKIVWEEEGVKVGTMDQSRPRKSELGKAK